MLAACARSSGTTAQRVDLRKVSGDTIQVIPTDDSLPYCLIFTQSGKGVTRQLTISKTNLSVKCPTGQPVLGQTYRIPSDEGPVKVHVFLSDQRLEAPRAGAVTHVLQQGFLLHDRVLRPAAVIVASEPPSGGKPE